MPTLIEETYTFLIRKNSTYLILYSLEFDKNIYGQKICFHPKVYVEENSANIGLPQTIYTFLCTRKALSRVC